MEQQAAIRSRQARPQVLLSAENLGGSINHRQAETGAAIAFCSKKWFQAPAADFVVHADACVGYFNLNSLWEVAVCEALRASLQPCA